MMPVRIGPTGTFEDAFAMGLSERHIPRTRPSTRSHGKSFGERT